MAVGSADPDATECPECGGSLVSESAEKVCHQCGLVVEESQIRYGRDWRAFDLEQRDSRKRGRATVTARHDKGLGSQPIAVDTDGYGNPLSESRRQLTERLHKREKAESISSSEKRLANGYMTVKRIHTALGISGFVDQSCRLLSQCQDHGLVHGAPLEASVAGVIYTVCRLESLPYRVSDIEPKARVSDHWIRQQYKRIIDEFSLPVQLQLSSDFVSRFCSELPDQRNINERYARRLCEQADFGIEFQGYQPSAIAGAAIYLAGDDVTQKEIADICGVGTSSIRRCQRQFEQTSSASIGSESDQSTAV